MKHSVLFKLALCSVIFTTGTTIVANAKTPTFYREIAKKNILAKPKPNTTILAQADTSSVERTVFNRINQYRQGRNLAPLTWDNSISNQARIHSQNMASGAVPFSHNGFQQRVQEIAKVISYRGAAENVAYNQGYADPAANAVQGWLNSSGHQRNIVGSYNLTGIGVARNSKGEYYFTQIFILKR
ncbi:CAP domain-containing protein [Chroococcidiopsidales cyanobacterium LEGE 13417]|nr:CAP domain-containing protein [Chroococcidiopsidales cyanobacterium LEGE 13417]